jgi:hypothetical protein
MNQQIVLTLAGACLIWVSGTTTKAIENGSDGPILRTQPIDNAGLLRLGGVVIAGWGLFSTLSKLPSDQSARQGKRALIDLQAQGVETYPGNALQDLGSVDEVDDIGVVDVIALNQLNRSTQAGRDVLDDLAEYRGHLLLSCRTQSGKTSTVLGVADRKIQRFGYANFTVVDPKGTVWGGLESITGGDNKTRVIRPDLDEPSTILQLKSKLEYLLALRSHRQKARNQATEQGTYTPPRDEIFLIDEFPAILKLAKDWDDEQMENSERGEKPPSLYKWLIRKLETLIFAGAEDCIFIWLVAQTHKVSQIGLDTGTRDNMGVWSQGRGGNFVSVEAAIADAWLIPGKGDRDRMVRDFGQLKQQSDIPVFYTNIGGHQMGRLVGLHDIKRKQIWAAQSPPQNVIPIRSAAPEDDDEWGAN